MYRSFGRFLVRVACFLPHAVYIGRRRGDRVCCHCPRGTAKKGNGMTDDLIRKWELSRRRALAAAAGAGLAGWAGGALGQPGGPWSVPPKSKVDRVNFVVWTYGDI